MEEDIVAVDQENEAVENLFPAPTQETVEAVPEVVKESVVPEPEVPYVPPVPQEPIGDDWQRADLFNVYNPYFGTKYNTGLNSYNPMEKTWDAENADWVKGLSVDDMFAVSQANSEEYAMEIMKRRTLYKESQMALAKDDSWTTTGLGFAAGFVDPTIAIPIGVTATATKSAYTLAAKSTRLAALAGESALVSMASVTLAVGAERGSGMDQSSYGMANLYAGLIGGGLPIIGSMASGGYQTAKVAKGMTNDPRNFLALSGELTAEKVGGTQLRTMYTRLMPDFLQSDVTFTAASNNEIVTLVSNRIDSPPMSVVDRDTGNIVAIGTTGQDYKQKFNGRQRMMNADIRGLQQQSTFNKLDTFNLEVGKVVRARAVEQENLTYTELNDHIAFTKSENKKAIAEEVKAFSQPPWEVYENGAWRLAKDEEELIAEVLPKRQTTPVAAKDIKKFKEEKEIEFNTKLEEAIEAKKAELYEANQLEFKHADPKVVEAAHKVDDYYKGVLDEGHKLKIHELQKISPNRHYMTRIFDFQKIREIDNATLINKISQGLRGHVANIEASASDIAKAAETIAAQLKQLDYTREWADFSFLVPKELGSTAFLRSKKFKLDDRAIQDLLVTDIEDVVGQYSYSQAGHMAANHAFPELQGLERKDQLDEFKRIFIEPLVKSGGNPKQIAKEVQSLQNMFEDMLGTFRMAKDSNSAVWKGTRIANSINSLTYGAGFVLNTASELGGLLLDGHVSNVMRVRLGSMKEIGTMFSGKTIDDPLVRDFVLMGQFENLMDTAGMQKMSDTDTVFNVGKVENALNKGTGEFFKYTGLRGATVAMEAIVGPKVIHDIMDFAKGPLTGSNQMYMARIGLNAKDVKYVADQLNRIGEFTKDGKIYDMHLDQWDEKSLDLITTAVSRGMRHTVIKGDTTYLPSFMIKPNAFNRLAFQFLRYPMAATETLMARGMQESPARWVAATGTSALMMGMVMYGREQAAIATGSVSERDAKFDRFWEDDEKAMNLFTVAFAKAGSLGGSSIFIDKLSAATGVPTPGSEYVHPDVLSALLGPTFNRVPQLRNILQPLLTEGTIDDRKQWNAMKGLIPGGTAPIISEWLKSQIDERTY